MTEIAERPSPRSYGSPEISRALIAVAYANGNTRKAERDLSEDGLRIDHSTLHEWKTKRHVEEYDRIRAEIMPRVREQAGDEHLDLAGRQMEAERLLVDRLKDNVEGIKPGELPGAVRNLAVSSAVHSEKAQMMHDQPTQRVAVDLSATLKELKSMGIDPEVVLDAEVVEEEDAAPA
jgi:hypothetical protein